MRPAEDDMDRAPAGADGDPDAFLDAFDAFAAAIRRSRGVPARDGDGRVGLTLSQYTLVRALAGRSTARIGDLAGDASVSPSTATRILDALERRAMVRRERLAEDRRGVTVTLTDRGQDALDRHDAWLRGRQRTFFAQLPDGERGVAADLLVRLATLIDELAEGPES